MTTPEWVACWSRENLNPQISIQNRQNLSWKEPPYIQTLTQGLKFEVVYGPGVCWNDMEGLHSFFECSNMLCGILGSGQAFKHWGSIDTRPRYPSHHGQSRHWSDAGSSWGSLFGTWKGTDDWKEGAGGQDFEFPFVDLETSRDWSIQ